MKQGNDKGSIHMVHRFSVRVNCLLSEGRLDTEGTRLSEELHNDCGFIVLPEQYSPQGTPTRLVISCHGAGGTVTTDDSQIEHQVLTHYLLANGYAVMDVNGLPEDYAAKKGIDLRNNVGSPIAIRSYIKAYRYCMERFNLLPEVFVHGGSMGGITSTNLVLSGRVPVIAHSAFCPVLDAYNEIFLRPWSDGLSKEALGRIYGFKTDGKGGYVYDRTLLRGYDPATDIEDVTYPVPVKFWRCEDDGTVSCEVTRAFVDKVCKNGGRACLRTFPHGGHEPQLVGEAVANPSGVQFYQGRKLDITPAVEEVFEWIKIFDSQKEAEK